MMSDDRIEVRFYGESGPFVVLVHGGPGAAGQMGAVGRRLSGRFRVVEPLQRASGEVPLTVAQHVADLCEVLRGPLEAGPVRLVGFSWGAMLALTYAARHTNDVERLILIGCGTFDSGSREAYQAAMAERMDADQRRRLEDLTTRLAAEADRQRRNELFAEIGCLATRIQAFDPLASESEEDMLFDEGGFRETWNDALSLQQQGVQPAEFARIEAPVKMIHGDADPHPGRRIFESLEPLVRDIQYRELSRCGHTPWIERHAKEAFYELLSECLGQ
jgi:pimeloyl-ACP methyl ester carboxylesterase